MHITGDVRLSIPISNGHITDVHALSSPGILGSAAAKWIMANWTPAPDTNGTFTQPVVFQVSHDGLYATPSTRTNSIPHVYLQTRQGESLGQQRLPTTTRQVLSGEQATAAFNSLQDRLHKPHAKSVSYGLGTDSYTWNGPKFGKIMSMPRSQFEAEAWPDYIKAHPTETPSGSSSGIGDLDSQIAAVDKQLNLVYARVRQRLNQAQRDELNRKEIKWIAHK
jgi:hypothetical protein